MIYILLYYTTIQKKVYIRLCTNELFQALKFHPAHIIMKDLKYKKRGGVGVFICVMSSVVIFFFFSSPFTALKLAMYNQR